MQNKKAFTLAELLFVFVIIGIIASVGMVTVKPWERAYKYSYMRIYNALSTAIYNYMTTTTETEPFPPTREKFCTALTKYINTSQSCKRGTFLTDTPTEYSFTRKDKDATAYLSNGAKMWIAADESNKPFTYTQQITDDISDTIRYYLVYIDLNGDVGPNTTVFSITGKTRRLPDIVAFAVTDKAIVIPLGYPKVDQRYLAAHLMYPVTDEDDETITEGERPSESMTYYEALVKAYGKDPKKLITLGLPQTYNLEESLPDENIFKLVKPNLDNKYANPPTFDKNSCGDGMTIDEIISQGLDSHCDVKVFTYN